MSQVKIAKIDVCLQQNEAIQITTTEDVIPVMRAKPIGHGLVELTIEMKRVEG